ncbi:MAG: hypothetical protein AAB475_01655 [Patescibacteria group bacterium]
MNIKKFILVFLALPVFLTGSEAVMGQVVDSGRHYCPVHNEFYVVAGEHGGSQCSRARTAPPQVEDGILLYCSKCNTKYPKRMEHTCPNKQPRVVVSRSNIGGSSIGFEERKDRADRKAFMNIYIFATQRPPQRYSIYNNYNYNLSVRGRNYFHSRFYHRNHHRRYGYCDKHHRSGHYREYGYGGHSYVK